MESANDVLPESDLLLAESELEDIPDTLPETELPDIAEPAVAEEPVAPDETPVPPPDNDLSWEVDESLVQPTDDGEPSAETADQAVALEVHEPEPVADAVVLEDRTEDLSWDDMAAARDPDVKEGMPFKEVEPPRVVSEDVDLATDVVIDHLFPVGRDDETREAVSHLFPEGRGVTSKDFIDVVVGTPKKVAVSTPMVELDTPSCPSCGVTLSGDEFEYPGYVYEAMGQARLEDGEARLGEKEFEAAIESFEKAKTLYERAGNQKMVDESVRRTDIGYDSMANDHFEQAENHRKANEFEWAIVQFRKARELYMFSTDAKKRARCATKVRECYVDWGKELESEGDKLTKDGRTRDALAKYQEAAEKYRQADEKKKLQSLDKKIRKA
ncbi:MAG: hypothetical protein ACXADS_04310 [Candidatus Thorarchaeota archaeon]